MIRYLAHNRFNLIDVAGFFFLAYLAESGHPVFGFFLFTLILSFSAAAEIRAGA